jgi:hypothetical protein
MSKVEKTDQSLSSTFDPSKEKDEERAKILRAYQRDIGRPKTKILCEKTMWGRTLEVREAFTLPEDPELDPERMVQIRPLWKVKKVAPEDASGSPSGDGMSGLHRQMTRSKEAEEDKAWKRVVETSLNVIPISNPLRLLCLWIVEQPAFDNFILILIILNSLLLAGEDQRDPDYFINILAEEIDVYLTVIFTIECVLKVIAFGFIRGPNAYLVDYWNWIDFTVVVTGLMMYLVPQQLLAPYLGEGFSLDFLRVFRVMRPLRALTVVPEMKKIVNTVLLSIPRLGNVGLMAMFLMTIFGILFVHFWGGIFFRACRATEQPVYDPIGDCWDFPLDENAEGRLCGGRYMCEYGLDAYPRGHCKSTHLDQNPMFVPKFYIGDVEVIPPWMAESVADGEIVIPWCDEKFNANTDHALTTEGFNFMITRFDNLMRAYVVIFQCITMEGWVDVMYMVQDAFHDLLPAVLFVLLLMFGSLFLLNIALAVVWEAYSTLSAQLDEEMGDEEEEEENTADAIDGEDGGEISKQQSGCAVLLPCLAPCLAKLRAFADGDFFQNIIMFFIIFNVCVMALTSHPPPRVQVQYIQQYTGYLFRWVFTVEFVVLHFAYGPKQYWTSMVTGFDGVIVFSSWVEIYMSSGGGALMALRGFRLLRIFKLAKKMKTFRILLKSMLQTVLSMRNFTVVLVLMMFVFTLMGMQFFATRLRFDEDDEGHKTRMALSMLLGGSPDPHEPYCVPKAELEEHPTYTDVWGQKVLTEDATGCVPRANFDTLLWASVTVFQVLSGENWNTVMYDAYISVGSWAFLYFIGLVVVGQLIFLNLFLAILMDNFAEAKESVEEEETSKANSKKAGQKKATELAVNALTGGLASGLASGARNEESNTASLDKNNFDGAAKVLNQINSDEAKHKYVFPNDYSLLLFNPNNPIRKMCMTITPPASRHKEYASKVSAHFDNFILALIMISSGLMVVDLPMEDPSSQMKVLLTNLNYVFTITFTIEMLIKCISMGLIFGKDAYLGNNWNRLDALVVTVSLMDMVPGSEGFSALRSARVLRALRPLRMISRAQNMKVVVNTLFKSVPELMNLVIVAVLFFLIFGLLACNFFKGKFYTCQVLDPDAGELVDADDYITSIPLWSKSGDDSSPPWLCIDANKLSPSFGAAWLISQEFFKVEITGDSDSIVKGSDCNTYLEALQLRPGGNLPPPHKNADLRFWSRASDDTPICEVSCPRNLDPGDPRLPEGCPGRLTAETTPSMCNGNGFFDPAGTTRVLDESTRTFSKFSGTGSLKHDETFEVAPGKKSFYMEIPGKYSEVNVRGSTFTSNWPEWQAAATRWMMPCNDVLFDDVEYKIEGCETRMCVKKDGKSIQFESLFPWEDRESTCETQCKGIEDFLPFYCSPPTCESENDNSETCLKCQSECKAACRCSEYCEPYKLDAAVCNERGGLWLNFNQNFDWVGAAMLTLFEISTTEGWVDAMYAGTDGVAAHVTPYRDFFPMSAWFFVAFIFVGSFFILNLCVGVIVDNFESLKADGQDGIMLTDMQKQWMEARKACSKEKLYFGLTHLENLSAPRRGAYFLVSSSKFENFIMACILGNTGVMAMQTFPSWELTMPGYTSTVTTSTLIFNIIFIIEAALKIFALRANYFSDYWNDFDFSCVAAAIFAYIARSLGYNLGTAMSAIRLFRIARLFRLLRFLKGLNKLFNAFLDSIPKLTNVALVLLLMLLLFSLMGMNMFGKVHWHSPHDVHANFSNFPRALLTLLRCMTGEGWNEIMHSVMHTEDYFGPTLLAPCVYDLEITADTWRSQLFEKCIYERPIECGPPVFAVLFFILYTCLLTFVILNLFVAVVLEGFDGDSGGDEQIIVEKCCEVWRRYDENLTMMIPMMSAAPFIEEVQAELGSHLSVRQRTIPMRNAYFVLGHMTLTGSPPMVSFSNALEGALRLILSNGDNDIIRELSAVVDDEELKDEDDAPKIVQEMAALRMQNAFRLRKEARLAEEGTKGDSRKEIPLESNGADESEQLPGAVEDSDAKPDADAKPGTDDDAQVEGKEDTESDRLNPNNPNRGDMPAAG